MLLDGSGNYLVQRIMDGLSDGQLGALVSEILDRIPDLCTNLFGSCVMQRLISKLAPRHDAASVLIQRVNESINLLATDQYGAYIVQQCIYNVNSDMTTVQREMREGGYSYLLGAARLCAGEFGEAGL